jgi:translation initiation factor IF-1
MVKNTGGGSKHKSMARKNMAGGAATGGPLRLPQEEGECFAKVSKMLGNGMCSVIVWNDNAQMQDVTCFIRGKFRSRNKKQNFVAPESFILVGLRDWSSSHDKCDLLHLYDDHSIQHLSSNSFLFRDFYYSFQNNDNNHNDQLIFNNNNNNNNNHDNNHNNTHLDLDIDIDIDLI